MWPCRRHLHPPTYEYVFRLQIIKRMREQWKPGPFLLPFSGLGTRLASTIIVRSFKWYWSGFLCFNKAGVWFTLKATGVNVHITFDHYWLNKTHLKCVNRLREQLQQIGWISFCSTQNKAFYGSLGESAPIIIDSFGLVLCPSRFSFLFPFPFPFLFSSQFPFPAFPVAAVKA